MEAEENERLERLSYFEQQAYATGIKRIAGIDEAGRGPWAGPVMAAAVILPPGLKLAGVNDSKKLSPARRERLATDIKAAALSWAVAGVSSRYIDAHNILRATKQAMRLAVEALQPLPDFLLIDAVVLDDISIRQQALIKGDQLSISIAAASILAKVTRDEAMGGYELLYADYGFAIHKGYGTRLHQEKLAIQGACPIHRRSFRPIQALPPRGGIF
jgi:ribonuclease HII